MTAWMTRGKRSARSSERSQRAVGASALSLTLLPDTAKRAFTMAWRAAIAVAAATTAAALPLSIQPLLPSQHLVVGAGVASERGDGCGNVEVPEVVDAVAGIGAGVVCGMSRLW